MTFETTMQRGASQLGNRGLQGVETVVQRQERVPSERNDDGLLLSFSVREAACEVAQTAEVRGNGLYDFYHAMEYRMPKDLMKPRSQVQVHLGERHPDLEGSLDAFHL
jgi:hypothetical protein